MLALHVGNVNDPTSACTSLNLTRLSRLAIASISSSGSMLWLEACSLALWALLCRIRSATLAGKCPIADRPPLVDGGGPTLIASTVGPAIIKQKSCVVLGSPAMCASVFVFVVRPRCLSLPHTHFMTAIVQAVSVSSYFHPMPSFAYVSIFLCVGGCGRVSVCLTAYCPYLFMYTNLDVQTHTHTHIYIYAVNLKAGPRFGGFNVKNWSNFKVKTGPSFSLFSLFL